jgi:hypothetical protein
MVNKKTKTIGNESFLLPFNANGFWVSDARGTSVMECRSTELAKAMAKLLNEVK